MKYRKSRNIPNYVFNYTIVWSMIYLANILCFVLLFLVLFVISTNFLQIISFFHYFLIPFTRQKSALDFLIIPQYWTPFISRKEYHLVNNNIVYNKIVLVLNKQVCQTKRKKKTNGEKVRTFAPPYSSYNIFKCRFTCTLNVLHITI